MTSPTSTATTLNILKDQWSHFSNRYPAYEHLQLLALPQPQDLDLSIKIDSSNLTVANSWLPVVEARIRGSVLPPDRHEEPSKEWLSADAANAAISFLRGGADLLPAEPHIYGTRKGDLVAEFETVNANVTSVMSDKQTILFAVLAGSPEEPIRQVIRRGSNRFREELRSFISKVVRPSHGQMDANR